MSFFFSSNNLLSIGSYSIIDIVLFMLLQIDCNYFYFIIKEGGFIYFLFLLFLKLLKQKRMKELIM